MKTNTKVIGQDIIIKTFLINQRLCKKIPNSQKGIFATNSNIQKDKSNKKQLGQK